MLFIGHGASVICSKIETNAQAQARAQTSNLLNLINRCEWGKKIQSSDDNNNKNDNDVKVSMKQGAQIKNKHTQFRRIQLMMKKKKKGKHSKLILLESDSDHSQSEWGLRISWFDALVAMITTSVDLFCSYKHIKYVDFKGKKTDSKLKNINHLIATTVDTKSIQCVEHFFFIVPLKQYVQR